ncbi:MAG: beta-lactamase family protein [Cyclobacteriaceae bacterium]|nr:beta-lactamase family protein [Cyclobacteriaceae bacterium]
MKIVRLFLIVCSALLTVSATAQTKTIPERIDELFAPWNNPEKPGAAVAVVQNGKMVFSKGYGMANLEYGIPNSPTTVFHVASVSKQFTVYAILLLEQDGKLSLEDDIRKHIPEVPDFGKTITLRHLANHTSGLRDQWNLLTLAGWRMDDVITKEHVLKLVSKQKELNFNPGDEYAYCNTGFTLLAEVVARVSGKSFAEFTHERIFEPLKMTQTLFYDDHQKIVKNRAYSYYRDGEVYKKSVLSYANVGATSLFTTVEDLAQWALHLNNPPASVASLVQQMNTKATLNNGQTYGGALGQFVNDYKGLPQIQHGGADAGYRTYLGRFPDQNFAVIVFSNDASFSSGSMALKVADVFLENNFVKAETPKTKKEKPVKTVKLLNKQLESFSGNYWDDVAKSSRKIYLKNDTLFYYRSDNNESAIIPISVTEFKMLNVPDDLRIVFGKNGEKSTMTVSIDGNDPSYFVEYEPANYTADQLKQFEGTYFSEELSTFYDLVVKNGKLTAVHPRLSDIEFTPIMADLFSGNRFFMGLVQFERNSQKVTALKVSSGRVRNLRFAKQ